MAAPTTSRPRSETRSAPFSCTGPARIELKISAVHLDTLLVARIDTAPLKLRWQRDGPDERDRYLFCFVRSGAVHVSEGEHVTMTHGAGLHVVVPGHSEVVVEILSEAQVVFFAFDRRDVAPLTIDGTILRQRVGTSSPIYQVAFAYLWNLAPISDAALVDSDAVRALHHLTGAVARSLMHALRTSDAAEPTLYQQARQIIEDRHVRPTTDVLHVAEELGVSRRTLERAFAAYNTSVADALREARVRHARSSLRSDSSRSLREVAQESGFGSVDSLRRALRSGRDRQT